MEVQPFTILDHTADIGLEAYGSNLEEAFIHAAEGMFSILSPAAQIKYERSASFQIEAETVKELLIVWLNQLLYLYDAEKLLPGYFKIKKLDGNSLEAEITGETVDPNKHKIDTYIKAATYHETKIIQDKNGHFSLQVIFDV